MKCPRCGNEVKEYEHEKYCSKCGFPINTPANDGHCPLHRMMFDVDARALVVNGTRYSTVKGFSMKGQPIIGETRFIINGQLYSPEQIGEQRAMELIRQKVDQAMEGFGFEKTYKEKTA